MKNKLKLIAEKFKIFYAKNPKKARVFFTVTAIIFLVGSWGLLAFAQSVIDSFTDATKIASTWNATVNTGAGTVTLANKNCDVANWFCAESTRCANTLGDGTYIIVNQNNSPTTKQWKTADTACGQPQCAIDGGQDGDNLRADNTISFTSYPAQDYCKSIGGRLPTITELGCIYTNRAYFGNNFGTDNYWSSTEYSATYARYVFFSSGSTTTSSKSNAYSVRCVRGW